MVIIQSIFAMHGLATGSYEHDNEPSGSTEGGEVPEQLNEHWLLGDSAPSGLLYGLLVLEVCRPVEVWPLHSDESVYRKLMQQLQCS